MSVNIYPTNIFFLYFENHLFVWQDVFDTFVLKPEDIVSNTNVTVSSATLLNAALCAVF